MGYQDAPGGGGGGGKLSLASVGFAGPGAGAGGGGYKELLVMPKDDGLDGARVAEVIAVRLPDVAGAVKVRRFLPPSFCDLHVAGATQRDESLLRFLPVPFLI